MLSSFIPVYMTTASAGPASVTSVSALGRGVYTREPPPARLRRFQFLFSDTFVFMLNTINISHSSSPLLTFFDL